MTTQTLPRYFLRHRLPDGDDRYAYPAALLAGTPSHEHDRLRAPAGNWTWTGIGQHGADVQVTWSGSWLVAQEQLAELTRTKPGPSVFAGWAKEKEARDPDGIPVSPQMLEEWKTAPDTPPDDVLEHWREHDAPHACWDCRRFVVIYRKVHEPGPPVVERQDLGSWQELSAPLPQPIDTDAWRYPPVGIRTGGILSGPHVEASQPRWAPDDSSRLAIYGAHTAHLWPGQLTGLRSAVAAALKAHPLVSDVYDQHDSRHHTRGDQGFRVTVHVPWETHRQRETWEKETPRSRKRQRKVLHDVWALERRMTLLVPDGVHGDSLADAVASWDAAVEQQLARFFPFGESVRACDHCQGLGFVDPAKPTPEVPRG